MTDIVDKKTRSRMMASIAGKDTQPELFVRRYLHGKGLRFRLHDKRLPGRPDIVLPRLNSVVEVRGCFWHRHEGCKKAYKPKSRQKFWMEKFRNNVGRDKRNDAALRKMGWRVHIVWECEINEYRLNKLYHALVAES